MDRKFIISTVVAFVVLVVGGFLVHGLWLGPTYETMTNMRPAAEQEALMHFMLIAHLLMAAAFVWVYQRGNEDKPWVQQGIRFGIAIALLSSIPFFMIYYTVQQTPAALAINQSIGDTVVLIVVGLVTAFLNKKTA